MSPIRPVRTPADDLLERVAPLAYPHRMRELALHARRHRETPGFRSLLRELAGREPYERRLALHLAMAARDLGHIEAALAGPDPALRRAALRAVRTLPVSDEAAAAVLDDAPADLRRAFYRTVFQSRREALADRLLPVIRERHGDREAGALLPACSAAVVEREYAALAHGVTSWRALGARHPRTFLDAADRELTGAPYPYVWWKRSKRAFAVAAAADPERAMALLETHDVGQWTLRLPARVVTAFLSTDADRAAPLVRPGRRRRRRAEHTARYTTRWRACSDERLAALAPGVHALPDLLKVLPPARRARVYDAVAARDGHALRGLAAMPVLPWLPAGRAAREARRMLDWHSSVWHSARSRLDDPEIPLRLTSHLPYEEAAGTLREAALRGDPRRRGLARTLLLECAARTRDPAVVGEVVAALAARTAGDQDPLRGELLRALSSIAPAVLPDGSAADLDRLAIAAIDARDSSAGTRREVRVLAERVLRHRDAATAPALTAWAWGVYEKLVARHGAEAFGGDGPPVDEVLRRGQEADLVTLLEPPLGVARERGDLRLAVELAGSLGRRAASFPALQDDLRSAIAAGDEELARTAARYWLAGADRDERVADLLAAHPAAVALPEVWSVVARRRTDLLPAALDGDPGWIPEVGAGDGGRWTPVQRDRIRNLLRAGASPEAALSLGRLPGSLAELSDLAGDEDGAVAEAAIEALAFTDRPAEALPILLRHGRGPVSRAAVAAMARCADRVPPAVLGPLLADELLGPATKVTVRKQAARQLARQRPPGAVGTLLSAWNDPATHPDVRVSVAAALRTMPEVPGTIEALGDAAVLYPGERLLRTLYQARPDEYAPADRPRYARLVRSLLGASEHPGVRFRATRAFGSWARWYEGGYADILDAVGDLAAPAERVELPVLRSLLHIGEVTGEVLPVLDRLLAAGPDETARARVRQIAAVLAGDAAHLEGTARQAIERLAARPLYLAQAAMIAAARLPRASGGGPATASDASRLATELAALAALLRDRPAHAARVATSEVTSRFRTYGANRFTPADLLPAARLLMDQGHFAAELFAVALVARVGPDTEWAPEWRDLLDGLRRSDHAEILQEAWDVDTR
ncbi:hypothetical protein [Spirillospora sp. NPDC047279]|uniref:hypothetical protein n=1 Tax=Spirillospora sp. NPDC047279 TaxID=3155478 RepID=UPI0033EE6887